MTKFQERAALISLLVLGFFVVLSLVTSRWGFFLWSLPPVFLNLMIAFFSKNNKYIQRFNQSRS